MNKRICLFVSLLILIFSFAGCSSTSSKTKIHPISIKPTENLIKIGEPTLKPNGNNDITEVMGQATNNNKVELNFDFHIIYIDADGKPLTDEVIQVTDIKPGETKNYSDTVMDINISKATHTIQFGQFFTYTK